MADKGRVKVPAHEKESAEQTNPKEARQSAKPEKQTGRSHTQRKCYPTNNFLIVEKTDDASQGYVVKTQLKVPRSKRWLAVVSTQ